MLPNTFKIRKATILRKTTVTTYLHSNDKNINPSYKLNLFHIIALTSSRKTTSYDSLPPAAENACCQPHSYTINTYLADFPHQPCTFILSCRLLFCTYLHHQQQQHTSFTAATSHFTYQYSPPNKNTNGTTPISFVLNPAGYLD